MVTLPLKRVLRQLKWVGISVRDGGVAKLGQVRRRKRLTRSLVAGKVGLEVGGPSRLFSSAGQAPVYPTARRVDNTNYSSRTVWEGEIEEGMSFRYDDAKPPGRQYCCDATDLGVIPVDTYDFVLSCHTLEHVANPILALREVRRVLKDDGVLILALPHYEGTFDHRRPVTPLDHLIDDYERGTDEHDLTHLDEVLARHDLGRDPMSGTPDQFRERALRNFEYRCLHHHVFDTHAAIALLDFVDFQLLDAEASSPSNILLIARKLGAGAQKDNRAFLDRSAAFYRTSAFKRDRVAGAPALAAR